MTGGYVSRGMRLRLGSLAARTLLFLLIAGWAAPTQGAQADNRNRPAGTYAFASLRAEASDQTLIMFWFNGSASRALQALWAESVDANEERVACLVGHEQPIRPGADTGHLHGVLVTNVVRITPTKTDSLHADSRKSVELCAPPGFLGTVHTHITLYYGQPYSTFSMSDREIMADWFRLHRRDHGNGLFCVLWSERMAYCEFKDLSGDVPYQRTDP